MDFFPDELKANPIPPILITGCPGLHLQLEAFFTKTLRPSLRVLRQTEETKTLEDLYRSHSLRTRALTKDASFRGAIHS